MSRWDISALLIITLFISSCAGSPAAISISTSPTPLPVVPSAVVNYTPVLPLEMPSATPLITATLVPTLKNITPQVCTCSPIEGIPGEDLRKIISNSFDMPEKGKDDGHHGVDFGFYRYGDQIGMSGLAVRSVLTGTVAAVIHNKLPYGNSVMVETSLESLPAEILAQLSLPDISPTVEPHSALYCPTTEAPRVWNSNPRSLYLLYAHMENDPQLEIGDLVGCCEQLGTVGTSGSSVNEHLHLELRVGPSGVHFEQMAHYQNDASAEEMINYCTWRVSNTFQLVDPMPLVDLLAAQ